MSPSRILSEGDDHHTSRSRDCVVSILASLDFDSIRFPSVPATAVESELTETPILTCLEINYPMISAAASVDRALSFNLEESVLAIFLQFPGFGERFWNLASSTGRFTRSIVRIFVARLNDLMEEKGGKKSSNKSLYYEAPLGYSIEYVRPNGGIKKFRSAAYSNCARKPS
ncbi:hypothetical protein MRB53_011445 [Persea americana]|uniref:Uncharacterized protein n=1 Tax=Persea americana TaxID=3435 RepID=A0ACC2LUZ6_PERAE|nr:hypothetical protein MRB53_011445 [Persea americana]